MTSDDPSSGLPRFNAAEIRAEAMASGFWLTALFFLLFRRKVGEWADEAGRSTAPRPKKSPFVYDLR